jgi:hypothetical protein
MSRLEVYVTEHCFRCPEARRLAEAAARRFPTVSVRVIDLEREPEARPDGLVAVPTYMLDGLVIALGNPHRAELFRHLERSLDAGRVEERSA